MNVVKGLIVLVLIAFSISAVCYATSGDQTTNVIVVESEGTVTDTEAVTVDPDGIGAPDTDILSEGITPIEADGNPEYKYINNDNNAPGPMPYEDELLQP